jgi:hypothetical protein
MVATVMLGLLPHFYDGCEHFHDVISENYDPGEALAV